MERRESTREREREQQEREGCRQTAGAVYYDDTT